MIDELPEVGEECREGGTDRVGPGQDEVTDHAGAREGIPVTVLRPGEVDCWKRQSMSKTVVLNKLFLIFY